MTERTEGIKEGLEMAAKWHDKKAEVGGHEVIAALRAGNTKSSIFYGQEKGFDLDSAEILRAKIEEIE